MIHNINRKLSSDGSSAKLDGYIQREGTVHVEGRKQRVHCTFLWPRLGNPSPANKLTINCIEQMISSTCSAEDCYLRLTVKRMQLFLAQNLSFANLWKTAQAESLSALNLSHLILLYVIIISEYYGIMLLYSTIMP